MKKIKSLLQTRQVNIPITTALNVVVLFVDAEDHIWTGGRKALQGLGVILGIGAAVATGAVIIPQLGGGISVKAALVDSASGENADEMRHQVGVDRIMWGTDYPHLEGTQPFTVEALRATFADVPEDEVRAIVGTNAAAVYDFDLDALSPLVDKIGPTVEEVATPLEAIPPGSLKCPAFDDWQKAKEAAA